MAEIDRAEMVAELVERYSMADRFGAVRRARQLLDAGVDDTVLAEVVGDAQRHVGSLWQSDAWTVAQEHTATAIAESVLATLDDARPQGRTRGRVVMVAADGEWHVLPARLAARAFEQAGIGVRFLGGSVPPSDLVRTLPTTGVDAVAVSVTLSRNLPGAARSIAACHAVGLPVVVGGQAVDAARAEVLGADVFAERASDAVAAVLGWASNGPPVPLARARLRIEPSTALHAARRELQAAALEEARRVAPTLDAGPDAELDRVTEDLDTHLAHLEAAVLLDDATVFAESLRWLESVLDAREATRTLELELGALERALDGHPEAHAVLLAAREARAPDGREVSEHA
jgi:methanogenic corrinoid protein MtbC1